jgi:hypothetical protein
MGTLCVIDDQPRHFGPKDLELLGELGQLVEALMDTRSATADALRLAEERGEALRKLDQTNRKLRQAERMANVGSWRLTLDDNRAEWSEQTYAIHGVPVGDGTRWPRRWNFSRWPHARSSRRPCAAPSTPARPSISRAISSTPMASCAACEAWPSWSWTMASPSP